ncbi:MAG: TSUP family transporter [Oscillospiraceae bacterium]|nr:TSUP family transporter [Oscillospiraceae bacterium]
MPLTPKMFLIVCPLLFLAGFVDSIAGGGGLISLPAYLFAGLPVHTAIGTNKLSSACGTSLTTARFIRGGLIRWKLVLPGIAAAMVGSGCGSRLSLLADEKIIRAVLFAVLPLAAFIVLNPRLFPEGEEREVRVDRRTVTVCVLAALIIGFYDGFYGPGTGTFLIIAFTAFAKLPIKAANAHAKTINLTTNITSLIVFLRGGTVLIPLGLAAAACNMLGNYVGSGLAMRSGAKITRPIILAVLLLLLIKLLTD